jgi:chromosome segregation ATPase
MKTIYRMALAAVSCLMLTAASHGQSQDSDSQTLRAILAELRAMHEDIRVTETTQMLLAELQLQQGVLDRAIESADHAKEALDQARHAEQQRAADMERLRDELDKATEPQVREALSARIEELKSLADQTKNAERDANANLQAMQQRLQEAQDKLAAIDDELSAAISRLAPLPK